MSDPALELQRAIVAKVKADVAGLQNRVFDRVPDNAPFPMMTMGEMQVLEDSAQCIEATETSITLHVWSRAVGQVEAKQIAASVRGALHEAELDLDPFALVEIRHRSTRYLNDPDGLTTHAVLEFAALIDH